MLGVVIDVLGEARELEDVLDRALAPLTARCGLALQGVDQLCGFLVLVIQALAELGDLLGDRAGIAGAILLHLLHLFAEFIEPLADRIDEGFDPALRFLMLGLEALLSLFEQLFRGHVQRLVRQSLEAVLHLLAQRGQALAFGLHRRIALFQPFAQGPQFR